MELKQVKFFLNKTVYYDDGQINIGQNSLNEYILSGCILRKNRHDKLFYQAELKDLNLNSAIIVPLEKVKIAKLKDWYFSYQSFLH